MPKSEARAWVCRTIERFDRDTHLQSKLSYSKMEAEVCMDAETVANNKSCFKYRDSEDQ